MAKVDRMYDDAALRGRRFGLKHRDCGNLSNVGEMWLGVGCGRQVEASSSPRGRLDLPLETRPKEEVSHALSLVSL